MSCGMGIGPRKKEEFLVSQTSVWGPETKTRKRELDV